MSGLVRHCAGLLLVGGLIGLFYYGWEFGLPEGEKSLRGLRLFGKAYPEFATLFAVFAAYGVMSLVQWLWDKVPGGPAEH